MNRELEDPFLYEPNELPLAVLHSEFNQRLVSLQPLTRGRRWGALEGTPGHAAVSDGCYKTSGFLLLFRTDNVKPMVF